MEHTPYPELLSLRGKVAIITGGAMGIGFGIAQRLSEAGAKVLIADLNEEAAAEAAQKLRDAGGEAASMAADVSKKEDAERMVAEAVSAFGGVDILVNDAGIFPNRPFMEMSEEDFARVIDINLKGVYLCTKAAAARMMEQGRGGKVINVTSIDAIHPSMIGLAHYDASKHGVWGFTKNIALELAPYNIHVNAIAPGGIMTPGVQKGGLNDAAVQAFAASIPMKRMGEPDDIGKVALFLASDMANYMTGAQIVVDGGALLS